MDEEPRTSTGLNFTQLLSSVVQLMLLYVHRHHKDY